ncbi:MAG: DUF192 domain-containing protein [Haloarculaceae archaeon]
MDRREFGWKLALFVVLAVVVVLVFNPPLWLVSTGEYDQATVRAVDANGSELATVDVRIADTQDKRRVGLSRTDRLQPGTGMLFVFETQSVHSFHMKNMNFPLDMVFVDANGTVTQIHHAPVPAAIPEDDIRTYEGRGKWVLEVNRGWANETGLVVGDRVEVPADV